MDRLPTVYILAKGFRGTLYTGVTSDLVARIHQHRTETTGGFTARYGIKRLVCVRSRWHHRRAPSPTRSGSSGGYASGSTR
jgi:predicted GIY-YIG superfamily endonuclease